MKKWPTPRAGNPGSRKPGTGGGGLERGSETAGLRELSLFSGAGGGLLGSMLLGWRTVAAVEIDPYCQRVLCARGGYMADTESDSGSELGGEHHEGRPLVGTSTDAGRGTGVGDSSERGGLDRRHQESGSEGVMEPFPVYSDIRDFHPVPGSCDIVTGGFPCQPFSQAGKRLGEDDPRNMWPHAVRVLRESGASLGFFENVPGLLSAHSELCPDCREPLELIEADIGCAYIDSDGELRGMLPIFWCEACQTLMDETAAIPDFYFGTVLGDLAEAGFDAEWCVLGADDVGAPHRRKRLWILAYRPGVRLEGSELQREWEPVNERSSDGRSPWWCDPADLPDTECGRFRRALLQMQEHGPIVQGPGQTRDAAFASDQPNDDWLLEPYVGRVAHGVASRVDRLRALGNGQVPQCMAAAFTYLAGQAGLLTWPVLELDSD